LVVSSTRKADARQCQDVVLKGTQVLRWLDEIGERLGGKKGDDGRPRVSRRPGDDHARGAGAALQALMADDDAIQRKA
jgi:hypothetical protein